MSLNVPFQQFQSLPFCLGFHPNPKKSSSRLADKMRSILSTETKAWDRLFSSDLLLFLKKQNDILLKYVLFQHSNSDAKFHITFISTTRQTFLPQKGHAVKIWLCLHDSGSSSIRNEKQNLVPCLYENVPKRTRRNPNKNKTTRALTGT